MRTRARRSAEVDDATTSLFLSLEVRQLASGLSKLTLGRYRKRFRHSLTKSEQIGPQDNNICLPAADINKITESTSLRPQRWPKDGSFCYTHTCMEVKQPANTHTHTHTQQTRDNRRCDLSFLNRQRQMFQCYEFLPGGDEVKVG